MNKVESLFPQTCSECELEFSVELDVTPLFSCHRCSRPSHNCKSIANLHLVLPAILPRGLVWECHYCLGNATAISGANRKCNSIENDQEKADEIVTEIKSDANKMNEDGRKNDDTCDANGHQTSPKINCKFYMRKQCKHGRKGRDCKFYHPDLCSKFTLRADKSGGCKKGENCSKTHPKLCWMSVEQKKCTRQNCKFYHIRGTKFNDVEIPISSNNEYKDSNRQINSGEAVGINKLNTHAKTYAETVKKPTNIALEETGRANPSRTDFLEMSLQIKALQDRMQLLMDMFRQPQQMSTQPQMMAQRPTGWAPTTQYSTMKACCLY